MPVNDKKRAYGTKLNDYINDYAKAFVVGCDNVGSKQMQAIRLSLRGSAVVLMGKNVRNTYLKIRA
jgi:large subunit ribosomal protein LP0